METEKSSKSIDLQGKTAVVTGGSKGIGAAIAKALAAAGADVALCDLHPTGEVREFVEGLGRRALALSCDVSDPAQVSSLFDEVYSSFGEISIVINNAGIYPAADLLKMTADEWDQTIAIDLKSVFLCTQAAARKMIAAGKGGAIVNIGSIEALSPASGHSHYVAAKAGVVAFGQAAAQELGRYQIRVNTVSPGLIDRPGLSSDWPDGYNRYQKRVPLQRVGQPEDIADACVFLASDASRWISGSHLVVDGGILSCQTY